MYAHNIKEASTKIISLLLASYECPYCGHEIKTQKPVLEGDIWDEMAMCKHCNGVHYKVVSCNGVINVKQLGEVT